MIVWMDEEREKKPRAPQAAQLILKEGDVIAGKYRIEGLLGCGGMAAVFAAVHKGLDHRVAIKTLLPEVMKHDSIIERFAREARSVAKLQSEHVARVIDVGELPDGAPYLVMEYLEGTDLSGLLKKRGPLPTHEVADIGIQACEGIAEAHALGIVHRDLKPANLFITTRADGETVVKVLDFGVAKTLSGPLSGKAEFDLTHTFDVVGSPHYMSPEQITCAKDVDARADIWAMGVVLHRLLTARPAFDGKSFAELCMAILQHEPRSLRKLRPDVPVGLEEIVLRCLTKHPSGRYQKIGELSEALRPYLEPAPVLDATKSASSPSLPNVLKPGQVSGDSPSASRSGASSRSNSASWKSRSQIALTADSSAAPIAVVGESPTVVPTINDGTLSTDVALSDLGISDDASQSVAPWRAITSEKLEGTKASRGGRKGIVMGTVGVVLAAAIAGTVLGVVRRPSNDAANPRVAAGTAVVSSPAPSPIAATDLPSPVLTAQTPSVVRLSEPLPVHSAPAPAPAPALVSVTHAKVAPIAASSGVSVLPVAAITPPPPVPPPVTPPHPPVAAPKTAPVATSRNPLSMDLKDM